MTLAEPKDPILTEGVPSPQRIEEAMPPLERRKKGAYVMIECFQNIPCDPCVHACRFKAIAEMTDINDIPKVDFEKCTGCGMCVAACPGLAIFVVDETYSDDECLIAMPYEFIPLPEKGERVQLLGRKGEPLGWGFAERVIKGKKPQGTSVVWVRAQKKLAMWARSFRLPEGGKVHAGS